jgi:hypothetical protein
MTTPTATAAALAELELYAADVPGVGEEELRGHPLKWLDKTLKTRKHGPLRVGLPTSASAPRKWVCFKNFWRGTRT